jgi:hypothetical protein
MTREMLQKIKDFAEENFCKEYTDIYGDDDEFAVTNPWIDHSGRFPLDDVGAVKEWGLDVVLDFCEKAKEKIKNNDNILCGFVWCHGDKDFSAWEVELRHEDREAIEKILSKYETEGSSERNVWDSKFSDVFAEKY